MCHACLFRGGNLVWYLGFVVTSARSCKPNPGAFGASAPAGRASHLAGGHWFCGCACRGLLSGSGSHRLPGAPLPGGLPGQRGRVPGSVHPVPPGAAASPGGGYGLDELVGLSLVSDSCGRFGLGTHEALHLPLYALYPPDPPRRQGHRGHPGLRPGNPGLPRQNVLGRSADLRRSHSGSFASYRPGANSVDGPLVLYPAGCGGFVGRLPDSSVHGAHPGPGFYDEVQHCLEDPSYSARFAPPTPPAYTPPAAGQQPPQPGTQYCPICGQPAPKAARFCNNCGTKLDGSTLG